MLVKLWISFVAANLGTLPSAFGACDLYLAPSMVKGAGRGVFAGRYFEEDDTVDITPSITLHHSVVETTQLNRYAYSSEHDDYRLLNLGSAMLFNHMPVASVTNYWTVDETEIPDSSIPISSPVSTFPDVDFSAQLNILQGQEIFANYGDSWFDDRDLDLSGTGGASVFVRDISELEVIGKCLTDIKIAESPIHGRGVFASQSFKAGGIVSVSPIFLLPKHLLGSPEANTVLLNYAITMEGSDAALVPMTKMAYVNHGGRNANLEVVWFDWNTRVASELPDIILNSSIDELESSPFSRLDIAYRARHDISEGEELTLDYGVSWEQAFAQHTAGGAEGAFLRGIEAPMGLFPQNWESLKCFGQHCKRQARKKIEALQNSIEGKKSVTTKKFEL